MKLIDADKLLGLMSDPMFKEGFRETMKIIIKNTPTIDAMPVVRCGECRYRQKAKVNRKGFLICPASGMEITDDDYCSYGERMCSAEIALDALREAEKRSKGCDLCMPVNTMKSMGAYGRKFMYCPMCGKRLEATHA